MGIKTSLSFNSLNIVSTKSVPTLMLPFSEEQKTSISLLILSRNFENRNTISLFFDEWLTKTLIYTSS